jgi:hypothetical protein
MKKNFMITFVVALAACGNHNAKSSSDTTLINPDTSSSVIVPIDTTGVGGINADTTGMGQAR